MDRAVSASQLLRSPAPALESRVQASRIVELDGLRAFAIIPVILHHSWPTGTWTTFIGEAGWMGVDLSQYDLDEPVGNVKSNAIQSVIANYAESAENGEEFTVRDIGRLGAIGGLGPFLIEIGRAHV